MGAQSTVKAAPEFMGIFKDFFPGSHLDIPNHSSGKIIMDKGADGGTCPAVKTLKCRVIRIGL